LQCNEEPCVKGKALVKRAKWIRLQTQFSTNIVVKSVFYFNLGGEILNACQRNEYESPSMLEEFQEELWT